jgi:hypothetical protein
MNTMIIAHTTTTKTDETAMEDVSGVKAEARYSFHDTGTIMGETRSGRRSSARTCGGRPFSAPSLADVAQGLGVQPPTVRGGVMTEATDDIMNKATTMSNGARRGERMRSGNPLRKEPKPCLVGGIRGIGEKRSADHNIIAIFMSNEGAVEKNSYFMDKVCTAGPMEDPLWPILDQDQAHLAPTMGMWATAPVIVLREGLEEIVLMKEAAGNEYGATARNPIDCAITKMHWEMVQCSPRALKGVMWSVRQPSART